MKVKDLKPGDRLKIGDETITIESIVTIDGLTYIKPKPVEIIKREED